MMSLFGKKYPQYISFPIFHKFQLQSVFSCLLGAMLFQILITFEHMFRDTQVADYIVFR